MMMTRISPWHAGGSSAQPGRARSDNLKCLLKSGVTSSAHASVVQKYYGYRHGGSDHAMTVIIMMPARAGCVIGRHRNGTLMMIR